MLNSLRLELIGFSLFPSKLSGGRGRREMTTADEREHWLTAQRKIYLREAFITDRCASESAEEKKRVIIVAEERYVSRIPLVKMEFKHSIE